MSKSLLHCVHRRCSSFPHWRRYLPTQDGVSNGQQNGVLPTTPSATSRFQPLEPPSAAAPQLLNPHQQHFRTSRRSAPTAHHHSTQHHFCQRHTQSSALSVGKLHDLLSPSPHKPPLPRPLRGTYDVRNWLQQRSNNR